MIYCIDVRQTKNKKGAMNMKKFVVKAVIIKKENIFDSKKYNFVFDNLEEAIKFQEEWESKSNDSFNYGAVVRRSIVCCNEVIICDSFTNTCRTCEANYNFEGTKLAPIEQWGYETGENFQDCY